MIFKETRFRSGVWSLGEEAPNLVDPRFICSQSLATRELIYLRGSNRKVAIKKLKINCKTQKTTNQIPKKEL
jgi:hypothetical protein